MQDKDFYVTTGVLADAVADGLVDVDGACAACPYHSECEKKELYWCCGVWEWSMGDDL